MTTDAIQKLEGPIVLVRSTPSTVSFRLARWWRRHFTGTESYLEWLIEQSGEHYRTRLAKLSGGDRGALEAEQFEEVNALHLDLSVHRTKEVLKRARKLKVLLPPKPDTEEEDDGLWLFEPERRWYLSDRGLHEVRRSIRAEEKALREIRKDRIGMVLPFFVALGGIIGALTGLVAVWLKLKN